MIAHVVIIDRRNKEYVVSSTEALWQRYRSFFEVTRYDEERSTPTHAATRLPDPPATVAAIVQVLQHDVFTVPDFVQDAQRNLSFLAKALLAAARYRLDPMARQALQLFDDHLKKFPSSLGNPVFAADFVTAVQAVYAPDSISYLGNISMLSGGKRIVHRERVPELKRILVDYTAERYEEMANDEMYNALFVHEPDEDSPEFKQDVQRAAMMIHGGSGWPAGDVDWTSFFGDERFVTIIDCMGKEYVTTRRNVFQTSTFLQLDPDPMPGSTFGNVIYKLPDHPHGVEAMVAMAEEGFCLFSVPDRIRDDPNSAVEWLTQALAIVNTYGVYCIKEAAMNTFIRESYLQRCHKPHTIVSAIKAIYAIKPLDVGGIFGGKVKLLKEYLAGYFAELSEAVLRKRVYKDLLERTPEFREDVLIERLKRMGGGGGDGGGNEGADSDDGARQTVQHGET